MSDDDQLDLFAKRGQDAQTEVDEILEAHARHTDPETSHEAAASIESESIQLTQLRVLHCLDTIGPQDDIGIAQWFRYQDHRWKASPSGLRTRRSELVARGLVRFSGHYGKSASNRRTRIWEITEAGRKLVRCCDMEEK